MNNVTISPKFQVVIPRAVREELDLKPGQQVHVLAYDGRIELIPVVSPQAMRGMLKGIDTAFEREHEDRM